jgi:hypothetical protein
MANKKLNREQLKEHIKKILSETIDANGVSGDYMNDMNNLASVTGETMDDDFLDSLAKYDNINNGYEGPVYPDRKKEEMDSDWREIDDQAKDTQARYGKNAKELDKFNAFSDTVDKYVNDFNLNPYNVAPGFDALADYDKAEAEREHPLESKIRETVNKVLSEVYAGDYDKPNHPDDFSNNYRINAHKFAHDGVDAYFARKYQDKMHNKEKENMKRADKRAMAAADKRPLHRKGSLNRAFDESKRHLKESTGQYLFHCYIEGQGNESMLVDDLNQIKPYIQKAKYWDVTKGWNATDPNNLIAWGGEGGYWYYFLNKPEWAKEGVHWNQPSDRERQLVLSKRKEINKPMAAFESKIRNMVKEAIDDYSDDEEHWKQEQDDEMSYDMRELTKAMQQANGTYHAKSSDGQFQTGDRVIVHGRTQNIEGVIKDFGTHLMTWEETCDVDYQKDGKTWTLMSVPLNKVEKITANESRNNKGKKLNEEWYPEEDDDLSDYSYGAIMKLNVDGMFDELTPEKVQELQSVKDEYIDNSNNYSSVMVNQIILQPDGFDGYDVSVEVAVSSPDMPIDAIEEEVESMVWYYIEEKTGVRSPRVYIVDEEEVFDRRSKNR